MNKSVDLAHQANSTVAARRYKSTEHTLPIIGILSYNVHVVCPQMLWQPVTDDVYYLINI